MALVRKHIVPVIAVVTAGTFLSACVTWQTQSLQPEQFRVADSTQTVRLTLASGETHIVQSPLIIGDSLVGMQAQVGSADSLERVSIPVAAIAKAETSRLDTAAFVATVVLVGALVAALANWHPCYVGPCN